MQSKNPKIFEYWFCQRLIDKIHNVFIKQHQRGRWLLAQSVTHASQRVPHCTKTPQKLTALYLLSLARVRKRAAA